MRFSTYIPAKIIYPDVSIKITSIINVSVFIASTWRPSFLILITTCPQISSFVSDNRNRFNDNGYGPLYNEVLDAAKLNATISKSHFGSCERRPDNDLLLNCTDALEMFQASAGDIYKLPVPMILLGNIQEIVTVGATSYELTHAMGSVTPEMERIQHELDMLDTVKADDFSIGVFIALPIIIYLLNVLKSKLIRRKNHFYGRQLDANIEGGHFVMNKLIRILLNQPNYTPKDATMKIMICLYLISTLFVLTVYRNIFGSDLTVTDGAVHMDYVSQFNASDRYVIYDPLQTTRNLVLASKGDAISDLFIKRTHATKSFRSLVQTTLIAKALMAQDAVTITNLQYHKYNEGAYCLYMLNQEIASPASRYHISKETFLPTVTSYAYRRGIDAELKYRLDKVLNVYLEYGLEDKHTEEKPRIAFRASTGGDDVYFCTQKSGFHHQNEENIPKNVSLKPLQKTLKGCLFFGVISIIILIMEITIDAINKIVDKIKGVKKRSKRRRNTQNMSKTPNRLSSDKRDAHHGIWKPCIVTNINYGTPTYVGHRNDIHGVWRDANIEIVEFKGYHKFRLRRK